MVDVNVDSNDVPRFLYKDDDGVIYETLEDVAKALKDGWHKTPAEAKKAKKVIPPVPASSGEKHGKGK